MYPRCALYPLHIQDLCRLGRAAASYAQPCAGVTDISDLSNKARVELWDTTEQHPAWDYRGEHHGPGTSSCLATQAHSLWHECMARPSAFASILFTISAAANYPGLDRTSIHRTSLCDLDCHVHNPLKFFCWQSGAAPPAGQHMPGVF